MSVLPPAGAGHPARVLYFAGSGRSGTTVINNILGQVEGAFACGELRYLWQRGLVENRLCGCGVPFRECPVWREVLADAFGASGAPEPKRVADDLLSRLSIPRVPRMLARQVLRRPAVPAHPDDAAIASLYLALSRHTGGAVIVDSSKLPPYGLLLSGLPIDLYVLHVVRDSRATAFSWRRRKPLLDFGDDQLMPQLHLWKSSLLWAWWNALTAALWSRQGHRYIRIRYEDFVRDPQQTMAEIVQMVGLDPATLPFETPTSVRLGPTHSVAGNPSRHAKGAVELRSDNEWMSAMGAGQRRLVTLLTAPVLLGLGYRLRSGRRRP